MVHLLQCSSVHILLFLFYILLLLASSMEVAFSDANSGGTDKVMAANKQEAARIKWERETEGRRALIGSRPPRCERVCMSCGHCEAVQVPIVPQEEKARAATAVTLAAAMFTYRVDGITNYKPLSWKCRCGGTILDP
ncbi:EPIDERMAL PATTERNING FACTOR-like protein 2 [Miscanthus floridulus]|uniref:EPIDERMAL PATTERNING FACTOR-like protein 2 n=1 Tax=Miscanthus floridulus TaxID=154761 RepID=UPI00345898CE